MVMARCHDFTAAVAVLLLTFSGTAAYSLDANSNPIDQHTASNLGGDASLDLSCLLPFDSEKITKGPHQLKFTHRLENDCKLACRRALATYDFVCFSIAYSASSMECVLYGNESGVVTHSKRFPQMDTSVVTGAAYYNNSCDLTGAYPCVDKVKSCTYQRSSPCRAYNVYSNKATTVTGKSCKNWSMTTNAAVGNHNYCANPDGSDGPWCYPVNPDPGATKEYCHNNCTIVTAEGTQCWNEQLGCVASGSSICVRDDVYSGTRSTTATGAACKNWLQTTWAGWPQVGNHNYCRSPGPDAPGPPWCFTATGWEYCFPTCSSAPKTCPAVPVNPGLKILRQKTWADGQLDANTPFPDDFTSPFNINVSITAQAGTTFTLDINNWSPRALAELRCRIYFKSDAKVPVEFTTPGPLKDWTYYQYQTVIPGLDNVNDVKEVRVLFPFPWYSISFVGYGRKQADDPFYLGLNANEKRTFARMTSDLRILFHLPKYRLWLLGYRMNQSDSVRHGRFADFDAKADNYLVTLGKTWVGGAGGFATLGFPDPRPKRIWTDAWASVANGRIKNYIDQWSSSPYWTLEHELQHNLGYSDREFQMQATQYMMQMLAEEAYASCILRWFQAPVERYEDTALLSAFQNPADGMVYVLSAYTYRMIDMKKFITVRGWNGYDCAPVGMDCYQFQNSSCKDQTYNGTKSTTLLGYTCQKWNVDSPQYSWFKDQGSHNYCRILGSYETQPWCYTTNGPRSDYCFKECGRLVQDPEDPLYCVKPDETCVYKNVPLCNGRIPPWAASLPDCDDIAASGLCIDEARGCFKQLTPKCKAETWAYNGSRFTSAEGIACAGSPSPLPDGKCYGHQQIPWCYVNPTTQDERDLCFQICDSEMQQRLRAKRRGYIQTRWREIWEPMKFSFITQSGLLAFVPYQYGASIPEEKVRIYHMASGQWQKEKPLADFLGPVRSYYNPQFLQGYGAFVGSQYCKLDETAMALTSCESLFTSVLWADLKKFSSGTADLDLVFVVDDLAFFFKSAEYIVFDLKLGQALPYYPKPTKDFLYRVGILGTSVAALI